MLHKRVKLVGKTQHGKNRVREQGEQWRVVGESDVVHFRTSSPGPYLLLESESEEGPHGPWSRWVSIQRDRDFMIEVTSE
jgi:hypothetical protein